MKTDPLLPDWSMPVFERFLKAPQRFELKRFRMDRYPHRCVHTTFTEVLKQSDSDRKTGPIDSGHNRSCAFYRATPKIHLGNSRR